MLTQYWAAPGFSSSSSRAQWSVRACCAPPQPELLHVAPPSRFRARFDNNAQRRRRLAEKDTRDHTRLPSFGHPCLHRGYSAVYRRQDRDANRDDSSVTLVGRCVFKLTVDDELVKLGSGLSSQWNRAMQRSDLNSR